MHRLSFTQLLTESRGRKLVVTAGFTLCICVLGLLSIPHFGHAGVFINEVLYDPDGTDTGTEWIEMANSGEVSEDISGWQLYPDGIGYFTFPTGSHLTPHGFGVVHLHTSGVNSGSDWYYPTAILNMGNVSGSVALFSGSDHGKDTLKSFVEWGRGGETWEATASDIGIWAKGTFVNTSALKDGNSIAHRSDSIGTGNTVWVVAVSPTPGSINGNISTATNSISTASSSSVTGATTTLSSLAPSSTSLYNIPPSSITAYAGDDQVVSVGAFTVLTGRARGINGGPLENARFWWNFGDGETQDGISVTHVFRIPGRYLVGLHVSSGEYAASSFVTVTVIPNQVRISDVISGRDGYTRLSNTSNYDLDLGGWILEDSRGQRFIFPPTTRIKAGSEIALSHVVTLIAADTVSLVTLQYPNGSHAFEWNPEVGRIASSSIPFVATVKTREIPIPAQALQTVDVSAPKKEATSSLSSSLAASSQALHVAAWGASNLFFVGAVILGVCAAGVFLLGRFIF